MSELTVTSGGEQISDKARALVLRELRDELGYRMIDGDWLGKRVDALDPPEPEFEDGDYAVWRGTEDRALTRFLAERCDGRWHVSGMGFSYPDDDMRTRFARIERLRIADDDEVIVRREDVREALDALNGAVWGRCTGSDCAGCQAARTQMRLRRALDEQGGEQR